MWNISYVRELCIQSQMCSFTSWHVIVCFETTEKNNPINTMRYRLLSTCEVGGVQWEMANIELTVISLWFYTKIALFGEIFIASETQSYTQILKHKHALVHTRKL